MMIQYSKPKTQNPKPKSRFWLGSTLKISPNNKVRFLHDLYLEKLTFSSNNRKIVKQIMQIENADTYVLSSKSGRASDCAKAIVWYVGFVERNDNVCFFCHKH